MPRAWRRSDRGRPLPRVSSGCSRSSTRGRRFPTSRKSVATCTTSGGMPRTPRDCGGERRSPSIASRSRPGRRCSISMRWRLLRRKIGSGTEPRYSSPRGGCASCRFRGAALMPTWFASSISRRTPSYPAASRCPRPRVAWPGGAARACSSPPTSVPDRSPPQAIHGRCGNGPAARLWPRHRSCMRASPKTWSCRPGGISRPGLNATS